MEQRKTIDGEITINRSDSGVSQKDNSETNGNDAEVQQDRHQSTLKDTHPEETAMQKIRLMLLAGKMED